MTKFNDSYSCFNIWSGPMPGIIENQRKLTSKAVSGYSNIYNERKHA